jgi:hypothetical protein
MKKLFNRGSIFQQLVATKYGFLLPSKKGLTKKYFKRNFHTI